jgi:hypothetical protein
MLGKAARRKLCNRPELHDKYAGKGSPVNARKYNALELAMLALSE